MELREVGTGRVVAAEVLNASLTHTTLLHSPRSSERARLVALLSLSRRRSSPKPQLPPLAYSLSSAPPPFTASSSGIGSFLSSDDGIRSNARSITVQRLVHRSMGKAQSAVQQDTAGNPADALISYGKAIELIELALHIQRDEDMSETSLEQSAMLQRHAALYKERVRKLEEKQKRLSTPEPFKGVVAGEAERHLLEMRHARRLSAHLGTPRSAGRPMEMESALTQLSRERQQRPDARRMTHAEIGIRFFHMLRDANGLLDASLREAAELRVWRCDLDRSTKADAATAIQSHVRVWLALRDQQYLQTLCRLILLMDSRERHAARRIQQQWRWRAARVGGSCVAMTAAMRRRAADDRTSERWRTFVEAPAVAQQATLLTPRGDSLFDAALVGPMTGRATTPTSKTRVRSSLRLETPPSLDQTTRNELHHGTSDRATPCCDRSNNDGCSSSSGSTAGGGDTRARRTPPTTTRLTIRNELAMLLAEEEALRQEELALLNEEERVLQQEELAFMVAQGGYENEQRSPARMGSQTRFSLTGSRDSIAEEEAAIAEEEELLALEEAAASEIMLSCAPDGDESGALSAALAMVLEETRGCHNEITGLESDERRRSSDSTVATPAPCAVRRSACLSSTPWSGTGSESTL